MTVSLWIHLLIIIWIYCLKKHEQQKLGRGFQCRNYGQLWGIFLELVPHSTKSLYTSC